MTFTGNFMPKRFGAGYSTLPQQKTKPQKPKVKTYRMKSKRGKR